MKKKIIPVLTVLILIFIILLIVLVSRKVREYLPGTEKQDLETYFGLTSED